MIGSHNFSLLKRMLKTFKVHVGTSRQRHVSVRALYPVLLQVTFHVTNTTICTPR